MAQFLKAFASARSEGSGLHSKLEMLGTIVSRLCFTQKNFG